MVVTDGRRPGYSVGMTNFELAQTMVRLGAVTGSAFDGGGSSSLAFDGKLLNRPSDRGGERPVSNALQLMYYGVYSPVPEAVISPNGDGYAEKQRELSYKVVRPSNVTATLVAPGGAVAFTETLLQQPGTYPVAFPPASADPTVVEPPPAEGRWRLEVTATDDLRAHVDDDADVHRQQHARVRQALAPLARRPRAGQADDLGRGDADARRPRDGDRRDDVRRPGRDNRRPPAPGRPLRRRAGAGRRAAASSSSTAACTSSASAPRTSSAPSRSSRPRSASSAPRRCRRRSRRALGLTSAGAGRLDPLGDHRSPHDGRRRLRPLRRLHPDADRRRLPGGERAGDGLRRRGRGGRVRRTGRHALRLDDRVRLPGVPRGRARGHDRLHARRDRRLVARPARRAALPRAARPLAPPERGEARAGPSAGSSAGRTGPSSSAG